MEHIAGYLFFGELCTSKREVSQEELYKLTKHSQMFLLVPVTGEAATAGNKPEVRGTNSVRGLKTLKMNSCKTRHHDQVNERQKTVLQVQRVYCRFTVFNIQ